MKCVICKRDETQSDFATLSVVEGESTLVVKDVPADICVDCGDRYLTEGVGKRVLTLVDEMVRSGLEVRTFDLS